ncbi:MAG TPA: M1 family metallopeptidase [Rubricoccaceae bacterium]|jgi:aminopeptidase N
MTPRPLLTAALPFVLALAAGCSGTRPAAPAAAVPQAVLTEPVAAGRPAPTQDVHSYAQPAYAAVTHVALDLTVDFETTTLGGTATLTVQARPGAREVVLDTRGLDVERVTDAAGAPLEFLFGVTDPILGAPLMVALPAEGDRVVVHYRTAPDAAAVQWLTPEQTSSGQPFLFTQGQAILTRTWVPTQDSPGIRQTYEAEVTVPRGLTAVMSAEALGDHDAMAPANAGADWPHQTTFRFRMDEPVPPYLIALAVGDLEFRELGPRTGVWAEPGVVEAAATEFQDVETMVTAAEGLYGPYRWGRYDLLVLPPSFPFGGMENPRLTFATPTILAGDRSLVSLVAHELAHSWSGNLVTNATWADFWLNEGFTTYFENRIMEAVYGAPHAEMLRQLGRTELLAELATLPPDDTRLKVDLAGRDPDAGFTTVPYEKGAAFLQTLEAAVGRARLDAFLRDYFDRNAFGPTTTELLLADLDRELFAGDAALRARVRPEEWLYAPGLPDNAPAVRSEALAQAEETAAAFAAGTGTEGLVTEGWATPQWLHFLQALPDALPADRLASLDRAYGLTRSGNSEVLFAWLRIAIANRYEPALPALESFLMRQGRRKYVRPLYADLAATDWGRPLAERIYAAARPTYHSVTAGSVDTILGIPGGR